MTGGPESVRPATAAGSGGPPCLVLLRGMPGVGKTATAYLLRQRLSPALCLGIDTVRYLVTPRVFTPEQLRASKIGAAKMAIHYVQAGFHAVVESVFGDPAIVREIEHLARSAGVRVEVFTLRSSVETTLERNSARDFFDRTAEERIRQLHEGYCWEIGRVVATDDAIAEEVADTIVKYLAADAEADRAPSPAPPGKTDRRLVLFMRHGAIERITDRYPADEELDLTPAGEAQVRSAADTVRRFRPTALFHSPLQRARRSAEIVAAELGLDLTADPRLSERYFPTLAGKTPEEIAALYSPELVARLHRDPDTDVPGEVPLATWRERVVAALDEIATHGRALVVSHGGPHSWLCTHYLGLPVSDHRGFSLGLARFSLFEFDADGKFRRLVASNTADLPLPGPR